MAHLYGTPGKFNVTVSCKNKLGQKSSNALALIQEAVGLLTVTVNCHTTFTDCFQRNEIVVSTTTTSGTEFVINFDMGNGATFSRYSLLSSNVTYQYTNNSFGTMVINVTAYNQVSSRTVTTELVVKELTALGEMRLSCPAVQLHDIINCSLSIAQGTGIKL